MDILTFGEKEAGIEYKVRPAVYCVIYNSQYDKIAIIQTTNGKYFLPGGGIEKNETHEQCLKREALEEMGVDIEIGKYLGNARRYFFSTNEFKHYLSDGYFYVCRKGEKIANPTEEDHFVKWINPIEAINHLFHEHQSWAVKEAIRLTK